MRSTFAFIFCTALPLFLHSASPVYAQSAPVVSGVAAAQRPDDSRLVDISYNLSASGPCIVWVLASDNGGVTWSVQAMSLTGHIGPNVTPGSGKSIIWDAGSDIPGRVGNFRVRVYADDGAGGSDSVLVPAGTYPYQGGAPIFIAGFLIDKYEVTNLRYCEFLNDGDPNGTYWDSGQEITRSGSAGSYTYAVYPGRQNYPIRYVSKNDADAYAAWLSAREGRSYRLPTEQEWEKAAAWDPTLARRWTYGYQSDAAACAYMNFFCGCPGYCVGNPTEVGHYNGTSGTNDARSYYGCYDMSGNVWEWTSSIYSDPFYVLRGGAWINVATYCTTAYRLNDAATTRNGYYGIRLALDPN